MPTDLDDIFASVNREADLIPLSTAAQARARGRRRTRNGLLAAAAAVCVVLAGVGVAANPDRRADKKTVAPTPSPSVSTAVAVGPLPQVGRPIAFGRTVNETHPVIVKSRVYTAWKAGTEISVVAADLRTGDVVWRVDGFEAGADLGASVTATDDAVLVSAGGIQTWVLDPADGNRMWEFTSSDLGEWMIHERAFVQRNDATGRVDAYDLRTGRKLWSISPSSDKVDRIIGMRLVGQELLRTALTDDRLVTVRRSGQVQVRDIVSGVVLRTTTPTSPPSGGNTLIAYDGKLFDGGAGCCDTDPYRVVVTDLSTGASKKIFRGELGHTTGSMDVCGPWVCLIDQESSTKSWVKAVDAARGGTIWSVSGPVDGTSLTANGTDMLVGGDGVTRLIDGNGREVFRTPEGEVEWLDGGYLVVMPPTTGGTVSVVNTAYGTVSRLGTLPSRTATCAHSPDRLVCPTPTSLRIYQLKR
ncbi:outer membrane protein assembly factor BamB family protein [Paractinoplanes brasiliensis]|uniref:Outer membrane protein assembly factor BamB n=1 Tax=Paractinoplanes brasiliensis TaxID=52695 RepID=A0A4R6JXR2_9ACTN|nr:PQQ-binding-like beta-propeller repeat protein [Actinoplanes brasiliensis]TDO40692.1 outer membrane protein assembly factor BamB [Actinoplanes brasiliensis]GID25763.1 hypothetical protein Abr02nite_07460 [Actinoplanes brasiliensis]